MYSFNKHLLCMVSMPGNVLGTKNKHSSEKQTPYSHRINTLTGKLTNNYNVIIRAMKNNKVGK